MKKLTEEQCLEMGGHCWNNYLDSEVDEFGNKTGMKNAVYYPNGEPKYRTCKHCGKTQELSYKWLEVKKYE